MLGRLLKGMLRTPAAPKSSAAPAADGTIRPVLDALACGDAAQAIRLCEPIVIAHPSDRRARQALAEALFAAERVDEAEAQFRQLVADEPDDIVARAWLVRIFEAADRHDETLAELEVMQALRPSAERRLLHATLAPQLYRSRDEIGQTRLRLAQGMSALLDESPAAFAQPLETLLQVPFYLAYHGEDDRPLQRLRARLVRHLYQPTVTQPPPRQRDGTGRIRVAFVSSHFYMHSIGRLNQGTIEALPRDRFEVCVFSLGTHDDAWARRIRASCDRYVALASRDLPDIERAIAAHAPDVLIYPDIGMDPLTYLLAFSRIAPVQCVTWGHPVTTGIDTIDYFISAEALEIRDADAHYSERLVRLPAFFLANYPAPALPPHPADRAALDLPGNARIYLCPQSLFKLHPDFDTVIGDILAADTAGIVVLIEGLRPAWTRFVRDRLADTIGSHAARVRFVPRLGGDDFLALMLASDVILDTLHFGGGNTTYEALAAGIPVVSLPSAFLRARFTQACYRELGIEGCIAGSATEYAALAVRLAQRSEESMALRRRIRAESARLFGRMDAVDALGAWLSHVCSEPVGSPAVSNRQEGVT
jgi:predicted O-linked N-acetylglucosamine transferase (SPINDLY family)